MERFIKKVIIVLITILPTICFATETQGNYQQSSVYVFNTLLFLIGGFLVMWMAAGFCMLEVGLVRSKNVVTQLTKNISIFAIAAIMYHIVGYKLMYPSDGWVLNGVIGSLGFTKLEDVGVLPENVEAIDYASVGSDFFFQLMFCATTASIVSGTLAERVKFWSFLIFTVILTGILYPIQASWKWGGGFLDTSFGFADFAGSTIVHSVGGWAALAGAIVLGPRLGRYKPKGRVVPFLGSNLPLATLGTFILWLGWFGFNGGSQLALGTISDAADVSRIFVNTNAAACGGVIAALLLTQIIYGKVDLTMVLNGALAGLVSITAEPLFPSITQATLIGAFGGVIVVFAVPILDKLKIDDAVGAIPVHLLSGIWGTLAVLITNPEATFIGQIVPILIIGVFVFAASYAIWLVLKLTIGIRVSAEEEIDGLDKHEFGMEAYPEFGLN